MNNTIHKNNIYKRFKAQGFKYNPETKTWGRDDINHPIDDMAFASIRKAERKCLAKRKRKLKRAIKGENV